MGKDLQVNYYPTQWQAVNDASERKEFSQNMARNWHLAFYDHWRGTPHELADLIREMAGPIGADSEDGDGYGWEAVGHLALILAECPRGWYIVIKNE